MSCPPVFNLRRARFHRKLSGEGKLTGKVRERIAVAVANANHCDDCPSAHNARSSLQGLTKPAPAAMDWAAGRFCPTLAHIHHGRAAALNRLLNRMDGPVILVATPTAVQSSRRWPRETQR